MMNWKTKGTALYQTLPKECKEHLRMCKPLMSVPADRPSQEVLYATWNEIKSKDNK